MYDFTFHDGWLYLGGGILFLLVSTLLLPADGQPDESQF